MTLICKEEFVNWLDREDREGTCACKLHQEKRSRSCTENEPAGFGFRVAGKYTTTWWMGARSESHYCTRELLPGPEQARNEDLLLQ